MQCIVKAQIEIDTQIPDKNEYLVLLEKIPNLPDGIFILNLTDAIILRNDSTNPFPMVTGNIPLGEYNFSSHIPILTISGQKGYSDIPIPNYDDINIILGKSTFDKSKFITNWKDKTNEKAFFRGGPTGCGYTEETNMRIKLFRMAEKNSSILDVQLSGKGSTIDTKSVRFDPVYGLGSLNTGIKPTNKFISMEEHSRFKYIIHIDGNVNAYRLLTSMLTGSLILRVESEYKSWAEQVLKNGKHYISIKSDLSNLLEKIEWCKKNDSKCAKIAENGMNLANEILTKEYIETYFKNVFGILSKNIIKEPKKENEFLEKKQRVLIKDKKEPIYKSSKIKTMKIKDYTKMTKKMVTF